MGRRQAIQAVMNAGPEASRRMFLAYAGALAASSYWAKSGWTTERPKFVADPFTLGVASGDPDAQSVVIWTRLAPAPLEGGGGMDPVPVSVRWEVAADDKFHSIVAMGTVVALPQLGHSVHVEVNGLESDRWYWYRFAAGDAVSPVGRTRTMPAANALPRELRFAFTSCQNYEQGLFTAYDQMARDELDLVCHLGDYIYEHEAGRDGKVRTHLGGEIQSLTDYRIRYAQYRSDPLLSHMHAQCPWLVTWDDHELDNNYAGEISEEQEIDPVDFLVRRANAYQAYYEMMPLRAACLPRGADMRLYRSVTFGQLANFQVLDTRQYRSNQPNDDKRSPLNAEALSKRQTMLGRDQYQWLCHQLITSPTEWNILAQQVMMGMVGRERSEDEPTYSMDQWPGYTAERMRLLQFLQERQVSNPVVLTGDIHSNWVNELRVDDRKPEERLVAAEFVATSLSSGGNGLAEPKKLQQIMSENPCVRFHNAERGYVRCVVSSQQWRSEFMVVDDVLQPGGKTEMRRAFVLEAGSSQVLLG